MPMHVQFNMYGRVQIIATAGCLVRVLANGHPNGGMLEASKPIALYASAPARSSN